MMKLEALPLRAEREEVVEKYRAVKRQAVAIVPVWVVGLLWAVVVLAVLALRVCL
jgi:hypothetical protein